MTKPAGAACDTCPRKAAACVLPELAKGKTRLVVIADSPFTEEVEKGRPLVGPTGREIDRQLWRFAGLKREDVHYTNAILCPGSDKTAAAARRACAKRLVEEVNATGCETVLAVAGMATQSAVGLSRKPSILNYRGAIIEKHDPLRGPLSVDATVLPVTQPDFVRRSQGKWDAVWDADFARLARVLKNGYVRPEDVPGRRTVIVRSFEQLLENLAKLGDTVGFDIETTDLLRPGVKMVCFVISDEMLTIVVPWSKTQSGDGEFFNGHQRDAAAAISEMFRTRKSVTHNGPAFDEIIAEWYGITLGEDKEDTLLAYHVFASHHRKNLSHVSRCYLDVPAWKEWDHNEDLQKLYEYCGRDGLYTRLSWDAVWGQMDEQDKVVYDSDKKSAQLCSTMSKNGFLFDVERGKEMAAALEAKELTLEKKARELVGVSELNLRSPLQMEDAFFKRLGARVYFKTESGKPSLAAQSLIAYAAGSNEAVSELALTLLEYRKLRKCRRTYIERIRIWPDGRVRPTWKSTGTVSGRWSAAEPNLANLPRQNNDPAYLLGLGGIRSLYTARPGRRLVAMDVKAAEYRTAAYMTNDPVMIAAIQGEEADPHAYTAAQMFGERYVNAPAGDAKKKLREVSKTTNFASLYLSGAATIQGQLADKGIEMSLQLVELNLMRSQRMLKAYYSFQARQLEKVIKTGYVETPILKRKRWLGHTPEASAVANFPIQGGVADIFNAKTWLIEQRVRAEGLDANLVASVYDAIYYDCSEKDAPRVGAIMKEIWDEPVQIGEHRVVLPIDYHEGDRWSEL